MTLENQIKIWNMFAEACEGDERNAAPFCKQIRDWLIELKERREKESRKAEDHFFPRTKIVNEHNVDAFLTIKKKSSDEIQRGEWIPIKFRPMTEEEVKEQEEKWGCTLADNEKIMFDCPLPEDGQEILISKSWGVSLDTCQYDPDDGYGLEENGDWDGVTAWMPLPEKYEEGKVI